MSGANPALRLVAFLTYVLLGVAGGQVAAWIVAAIALFANLTGIVATVLGDGVAAGAIFLIGSAVYAIVVGAATSYALSALAGQDDVADPEAFAGLIVGAAAFLLVTLLAEPFVRAVIEILPGAAIALGEATGLAEFAGAVLLHSVPLGLLALASWLVLRAVMRSSVEAET